MNIFISGKKNLFIYFLYFVLAVMVLFPLSWVIFTAFKPATEIFSIPVKFVPRKPTFESFIHVLFKSDMLRYLLNTIFVCVIATLLTLAFAAPAAYGFSKYRFKLKYPLLITMLGLQLIPGTVNIIPYYMMMARLNLLNTFTGLILVFGAGGIPFSIWILKSFFDSLSDSMVEAARVDGASGFIIFFRIMLPLSLPGLGAAFFLRFFNDWSNFLLPMIIAGARRTMMVSVGLYNYVGHVGAESPVPLNRVFAAAIIGVMPVVVIYFFVQETFISGLAAGSGK